MVTVNCAILLSPPQQSQGSKSTAAWIHCNTEPGINSCILEHKEQQDPAARMSEDQVASAVQTATEDDGVIPNGKGHEPSEATATSVPPAGNEEKWVFS